MSGARGWEARLPGRRLSIRARISGGSLIIAVVISIAAGLVIDTQVHRIVRDGTIAVLRSDAAPYLVELRSGDPGRFESPGPSQLVAVVNPDGAFALDTLPKSLRSRIAEIVEDDETHSYGTGDSRYLVRATPERLGGGLWHVVAARKADSEDAVLGQMQVLLAVGLALVDLGVAATAWLLTSFALRPVTRLRRAADSLSGTRTGEVLPVGPARDEIAELAETLNQLIRRLRASADRERQLVSDASHELRTPVAILRTRLELARAEASSVEQLTRDIEAAERSTERLGTLLDSMLALSSIEADDRRPDAATPPSELRVEAREAADRARLRAPSGVAVHFEVAGDGAADGSDRGLDADTGISVPIRPEDLGRVLDNLVGNALRAMGDQGSLRLRWQQSAEWIRLAVSDDGGGLDPEFEPHAFERFTRGDASRARADGAGLGLPIVAALIGAAQGTIALQNHPGSGLTVLVELPIERKPSDG